MLGVLFRCFIYTTSCAECGEADTVYGARNYRDAEQTFRVLGWSKCKQGWTCPDCAGKGELD